MWYLKEIRSDGTFAVIDVADSFAAIWARAAAHCAVINCRPPALASGYLIEEM